MGCSGSTESARQRESSHLRALVTFFNYAATKLGHRPANEAELKSFIAANGAQTLETSHISNADELFVSERDGEPFVVLYGPAPSGPARDVIAYERTGVGGHRLVAYSIGAIGEVDEQEFAGLIPAQNRKGT